MISRVEFKNYKSLRSTALDLGGFTLLLGANGSGKTSAMRAIALMAGNGPPTQFSQMVSVGMTPEEWQAQGVSISATFAAPFERFRCRYTFSPQGGGQAWEPSSPPQALSNDLRSIRYVAFDPERMRYPGVGTAEIAPDGVGLAGVLDRIDDEDRKLFDALNSEVSTVLPEYDQILFQQLGSGQKAFALRTRDGRHKIPAQELSHGSILVVGILALSYLPLPPAVVCLEEPDRGVHPRLLQNIRDALYRLAYPDHFGLKRRPTQVIASSQSPLFVNLFKDHPEQVVIAEKKGLWATFQKLTERRDIDEILRETPLGDVWYTGVLGGVPGP